jgi:hypothetical protein
MTTLFEVQEAMAVDYQRFGCRRQRRWRRPVRPKGV